MIAEVYPLKRMPRSVKWYDYQIPEGLTLTRGTLVQIPFRRSTIWGVVRNIKDKPPRGIALKPIISAQKEIQLTGDELSFFEWLAHDLAQSIPSILHAAIPTPPKQASSERAEDFSWKSFTLPSSDAGRVVRHVRAMNERANAFIQVPDLKRAAAVTLGYIQTNPDEKILILAPTIRDVKQMKTYMSGINPIVITNKDTNNQRWNKWATWRTKTQGVLIGTRFAGLLIDESITSIILIHSTDSGHKNSTRNPRYDMRRLTRIMQERFNTKRFLLDEIPSTDDLLQTNDVNILEWHDTLEPIIVDLNQERGQGANYMLAHTTLEHIWQAKNDGKQVLCILNKKGQGSLRMCQDCQHKLTCQRCQTSLKIADHFMVCNRCRSHTPLQTTCPSCQGTNLKDIGWGNTRVAKELKNLFPHSTVQICDADHTSAPNADILVVTQWWLHNQFNPFAKTNIGAVIHLNTDLSLHSNHPRTIEQTTQSLWTWRGVAAHARSPFIVQTTSAPLIQSMLQEPLNLLKDELQTYESYGLPPYTRMTSVTFKDDEPRKVELALTQLQAQIEKAIPQATIEQRFNAQEHLIEVSVPIQQQEQLLTLFTALPDTYIIDTDAFSR